jgi:hypothetical protein
VSWPGPIWGFQVTPAARVSGWARIHSLSPLFTPAGAGRHIATCCKGFARLAVTLQQTLFLDGQEAHMWPYAFLVTGVVLILIAVGTSV